jgi:hypothetical protein
VPLIEPVHTLRCDCGWFGSLLEPFAQLTAERYPHFQIARITRFSRRCPQGPQRENGPTADIGPKQSNVRFGEKQTSAQNSFGFLLIESLTILALTDNTRANTLPTGSVYAQSWVLKGYCPEKPDRILGVTGEKFSTTRSYKSAALPTELRQPNQTGTCYNRPV